MFKQLQFRHISTSTAALAARVRLLGAVADSVFVETGCLKMAYSAQGTEAEVQEVIDRLKTPTVIFRRDKVPKVSVIISSRDVQDHAVLEALSETSTPSI